MFLEQSYAQRIVHCSGLTSHDLSSAGFDGSQEQAEYCVIMIVSCFGGFISTFNIDLVSSFPYLQTVSDVSVQFG